MAHQAQTQVWEEAARKAKARNTVVDAAIQAARKQAKSVADLDQVSREIADLEAERLPMPPTPRLFSSDPTEQRLFQLLHERGGAFAVLSGEGRPVIDSIAGKYSGDGRTGDAIYLAGISGDTITRDRVGNPESGPEERVISRPCLNVCIMVQPDKYLEAAAHPALRASGALARIWPAWFPSLVGQRIEAEDEAGLDATALKPYNELVGVLLDRGAQQDAQAKSRPHKVSLAPEASEARRIFHNRVEEMMGDGQALDDCRDIAAKAVSQTVKLALCLHLAETPMATTEPASEISLATWAAAEDLGQWFLGEAVRVQRMADEDPILEAARRVLSWVKASRLSLVTARNLQREGPRPRPKARDAAAVLEFLAGYHYLRSASPPGTRAPVYQVHQSLLSPMSPMSPVTLRNATEPAAVTDPTATVATLATPLDPDAAADLPYAEVF